jgi:hypothetical protein
MMSIFSDKISISRYASIPDEVCPTPSNGMGAEIVVENTFVEVSNI